MNVLKSNTIIAINEGLTNCQLQLLVHVWFDDDCLVVCWKLIKLCHQRTLIIVFVVLDVTLRRKLHFFYCAHLATILQFITVIFKLSKELFLN